MNPREAKDFLVQQTAKQTLLENLSFADLEKRMMYFSESDPAACAKPLELNEEFESQYDTAEYEAKISGLLQRAYERLKVQDLEAAQIWDQSVRELRQGDHYLLVLLDAAPNAPIRVKATWKGLLALVGIKSSRSD
jgi:hypothetical protein